MNTEKRISVLLADDHMLIREGLKTLLSVESDIEVVGEAVTGRQAVELTRKLLPDVVLMDISMPQTNGLSVVDYNYPPRHNRCQQRWLAERFVVTPRWRAVRSCSGYGRGC